MLYFCLIASPGGQEGHSAIVLLDFGVDNLAIDLFLMRYDHEPSLFCVTPVYFAIALHPKIIMQSVSLAIL